MSKLSPAFIKRLNAANVGRDDPHLSEFKLYDNGKPIVGGELTEYPSSINTQKLFLDDVLSDRSDFDKGAVDLDTAAGNEKFLQQSIQNQVARENELSTAGIQLASQINK